MFARFRLRGPEFSAAFHESGRIERFENRRFVVDHPLHPGFRLSFQAANDKKDHNEEKDPHPHAHADDQVERDAQEFPARRAKDDEAPRHDRRKAEKAQDSDPSHENVENHHADADQKEENPRPVEGQNPEAERAEKKARAEKLSAGDEPAAASKAESAAPETPSEKSASITREERDVEEMFAHAADRKEAYAIVRRLYEQGYSVDNIARLSGIPSGEIFLVAQLGGR